MSLGRFPWQGRKEYATLKANQLQEIRLSSMAFGRIGYIKLTCDGHTTYEVGRKRIYDFYYTLQWYLGLLELLFNKRRIGLYYFYELQQTQQTVPALRLLLMTKRKFVLSSCCLTSHCFFRRAEIGNIVAIITASRRHYNRMNSMLATTDLRFASVLRVPLRLGRYMFDGTALAHSELASAAWVVGLLILNINLLMSVTSPGTG